ncbi:DNA-binding MarR family transcriptional regulator [Caulobacter ginsengisoli]|uniref:DNA-binding MarR family transcriptional regulator n=1 Tax=Caulobacter ginsengisoli TaxID=400775 RepID=A0ABU0IRC8_9CAUL|nr:hypothetical protein [Caulobacter ginsengisoli]MDQ0464568.1 DNA-binding MarR family transcriptional regulator [Caulobacter ginsengisoli]
MRNWTLAEAAEVISDEQISAARRLPGLVEAGRRSAASWLPRPGDTKMVAATLRDLGRMVSGVWAIYLDASPGGLTLARLAKLLEGTRLSSPGRARALLIYMQFLGYVQPARREADRRERHYTITPALFEAFHERYRRDLATVADLDPLIAEILRRIEEPGVFRAFVRVHGDFLAAGFKTWRPEGPSLDIFSERFSGMVVLSLILFSGVERDSFPPRQPAPINVARLSRDAGISRAQVRQLLKAGEKAGFFDLRTEGVVVLTQQLYDNLEILTAGVMVIFRECARRTLAYLAEGPEEV